MYLTSLESSKHDLNSVALTLWNTQGITNLKIPSQIAFVCETGNNWLAIKWASQVNQIF